MISPKLVDEQLEKLGFNHRGWGRTEVRELQNIILPDEEIFECVNGIYEGGFALLLATNVRVLLVDKKPLNYLTVEDLRFDMINEIDYSHRLLGAYIKISAGEINLKFTSINQPRLRKLIGHVQFCMAEAKKNQATHPHLEQINQQLQSYLLAQYEQQQKLHERLSDLQASQKAGAAAQPPPPKPPEISPELSDYLLAQRLLAQHKARAGTQPEEPTVTGPAQPVIEPAPEIVPTTHDELAELYADGMQEVFGKHERALAEAGRQHHSLEVNSLRVAYGKLPQALRNRKFGKPSFHARGQESVSVPNEL